MSKKQEDSNEQVKRAGLVYYHLPAWMKSVYPMRKNRDNSGYLSNEGRFDLVDSMGNELSRLWALAQGEKQIRQYTATRVFIDEGRTQDELMDAVQAMTPTIMEAGGVGVHCGLDIVSSAGPGPFMELVKDLTSSISDEYVYEPKTAPIFYQSNPIKITDYYTPIIHGLDIKKNRNNFVVLRLHYTADEEKRTDEWRNKARSKFMTEWMWQQEMEIDYEARGGHKVFADVWNDTVHYISPARIPKQLTLYRAIDYGRVHPTCCLWAGVDKKGDLYVIRNYKNTDKGISEHAKNINARSFNEAYAWTVIDQSTIQQKEHGHATIFNQFEEAGIQGLIPSQKVSGKDNFDPGLELIYNGLRVAILRSKGVNETGMAIYVSQSCPEMKWEMLNLRFQKPRGDMLRSEKTVDIDDDLIDTLRYILLESPVYFDPGLNKDVDRKVKEYGAMLNAM